MGLYSLLLSLFAIGAAGTFLANKRTDAVADRRQRWIKFWTYFALVFVQLYLISENLYPWLAVAVALLGTYELLAVAKSWKWLVAALVLFGSASFGFWRYFSTEQIAQQQFAFVGVVVFDGFSQIAGQLFGKTKLFPKTSPGKTAEGLAGGFLGLAGCVFALLHLLEIGISEALANALLIGTFAVVGDFLASLYKRQNSIKDYSRLIPGHGGVLDRFDSLVFVSAGLFFINNLDLGVEWQNVFGIALTFGLVFALAETAYHVFRLKCEITRKFVHVSSGLICLGFPVWLESWISVFLLCAGFIALLWISRQRGFLNSVNAIGRKSVGSLCFPVAVFGCFCMYLFTDLVLYFYLPMLILAICDPLAAFFGKTCPYGKYKVGKSQKTLMGSVAFAASCCAISATAFGFLGIGFSVPNLMVCLAFSAVAAFSEAVSRNGFDNLVIPASAIGFLYVSGIAQ